MNVAELTSNRTKVELKPYCRFGKLKHYTSNRTKVELKLAIFA